MIANIPMVQWLQITFLWSCISEVASLRNLHPIGVSNKSIIPDDRFTASSTASCPQCKPHYARLNRMEGVWAPKTRNDSRDYLQIDLGAVFVIRAVATQGDSGMAWTTEYKISTSTDSTHWTMYQSGGKVKHFPGNTDSNTVKTNILDSPVEARFLRFIPTKYFNWKALRVEVYGLKKLEPKTEFGHLRAV